MLLGWPVCQTRGTSQLTNQRDMADSSCMGGCVLSASSLLVASCYTVSQNGVVYTLASPVGQRKTTKKSNPEHRDQGRGRHWKLRPRGACAAVRASCGLCSKHPTGRLPEQLPGEGSWATHLAPLYLRFSASQRSAPAPCAPSIARPRRAAPLHTCTWTDAWLHPSCSAAV